MQSFLSRFGSLILFVLSGFDRLRFRGASRYLNHARGVESYLWQQCILRKDFAAHAERLTRNLRQGTEALAQAEGVPIKHLNSPNTDKEADALALAHAHDRTTGRIALLTCVESCQTYRARKDDAGLLVMRKEEGRCLHYYHYFQHPGVGLCYVRVQTYFPFTVHIGLNGRQWLYRQLQQRGIGFRRQGNLLTAVDDWSAAQALLDEQRHTDWPTLLSEMTAPIQPLWSYLHDTVRAPYYWMTEQSEWASDLVFRSRQELAQWYPRWLHHGIEHLDCKDVMRYLGKHVPAHSFGTCTGEAKIDLRERVGGARLKFWYHSNSLKIYDKEGQALRVETTINQPGNFRVYRAKEGAADDAPKSWQQMRKGVADLHRQADVSHSANERLLQSLASIAQTTPLGKLLEPLSRPAQTLRGRRVRALNPLTGADGTLLRCLARGDFLLQGFRNRDVRAALCVPTADPDEQGRQSAAIGRKLTMLQAHGIIFRVQKTHRYQLSAQGKRITTALRAAYTSDINNLTTPP
jgi:hypothetical protein